MLRIGHHTFEVEATTFRAHISIGESGWHVWWDLQVIAQPREIDGTEWAPRLGSHLPLEHLPVPERLAGTQFGPLPVDESGEPPFLLYIFEHEAVTDTVLSFGERRGTEFQLTLAGKTANWDETAGEPEVPVELTCWLPFDGVKVDEFHVEKARQRLAQFFGPTEWSNPRVENYQHVVSWLGPPERS
jgi:hypothetical protein